MSCQCGTCGNGCQNYTTPTSFSGVDISGSSIVGSTISGSTISSSVIVGYSVDTIADLKALSVASLTVDVVQVLGYSATGDGGGGVFQYDSTSIAAPNNGTIFQPNSGSGRWLRVFSGALNVRWFGATGDGSTDDSAAIQAAVDALPVEGGFVFVPAGEYYIEFQITLDKRMTLQGEGATETSGVAAPTIIKKASTLNVSAIELTSASSNVFDLAVIGEVGNVGDGIEILANGCSLRNVSVSSMGQDGIRIGADAGTNANSWSLINVNSSGNTRHGVYLHDLNFNANAGLAARLACLGNGGDGVRNRHADKNTFSGCLMEGNTGYGWHFLTDASHQSINLVVGGDSEGNTAGDVLVAKTSWYNVFINPGALGTATYNVFTTVISEQVNRIASNVTNGELLSNAPQGGAGAAGTQEYYSVYDSSAVERMRVGFNVNAGPKVDLVPTQVMGTVDGDVIIASRDINYGSVRFYVGLGPVARAGVYGPDGTFWVGPGPTNSNAAHVFFQVPNGGWNGAATGAYVGANAVTSRSINAAGTLNASGTDYAEYLTKEDPEVTIAKGDVCGISANGKLTTVFADAVAFVVKSTNPSYVGGDSWGTKEVLGDPPARPAPLQPLDTFKTQAAADEYAVRRGFANYSAALINHNAALAEYAALKEDYEARLETARVAVDRVAFSGQVPVNVSGEVAVGDYIVPQASGEGIVGVGVSADAITFAQYRLAVGRVTHFLPDGRPSIVVKTS